jgi:SAM-dependent methyltransferase
MADRGGYIQEFSWIGSDNLVCKLFSQYITRGSEILELGSGSGFIADWTKDDGYKIQESDGNPSVVRINRSERRNIEVADIYDLPYWNDKFEVVVGLNLFDVLSDLDKALREVRRVLRLNENLEKSGTLMAINDKGFLYNTFVKKYLTDETIPLPFIDMSPTKLLECGLNVVRKKDLNTIVQTLDKMAYDGDFERRHEIGSKDKLLSYFGDPLSILFKRNEKLNIGFYDYLKFQRAIIKSGFEYEKVLSNEEGPNRLQEGLENNDFEILEFGRREVLGYLDVIFCPEDYLYPCYKIPEGAKMLVFDGMREYFCDSLDERFENAPEGKFPLLRKIFVAVAQKRND